LGIQVLTTERNASLKTTMQCNPNHVNLFVAHPHHVQLTVCMTRLHILILSYIQSTTQDVDVPYKQIHMIRITLHGGFQRSIPFCSQYL